MSKITKNNQENIIIGERIRSVRESKNWTQKRLAKMIGIPENQSNIISGYETGDRKVTIKHLKDIAYQLNVSSDYLLGLTQFQSSNVNYRAINKLTGLNDKAIAILKKLNNDYSGYLIDTINFLIEQDNPFPSEFGFSLPTEYSQNKALIKKAEEKALQEYQDYEEKWNKTYTPILSMIDSYLKAEAEDEKISIKNTSLKKIVGNDNLGQELLPKIIITSTDLIDNVYLSKIKKGLRRAKNKYIKKYVKK